MTIPLRPNEPKTTSPAPLSYALASSFFTDSPALFHKELSAQLDPPSQDSRDDCVSDNSDKQKQEDVLSPPEIENAEDEEEESLIVDAIGNLDLDAEFLLTPEKEEADVESNQSEGTEPSALLVNSSQLGSGDIDANAATTNATTTVPAAASFINVSHPFLDLHTFGDPYHPNHLMYPPHLTHHHHHPYFVPAAHGSLPGPTMLDHRGFMPSSSQWASPRDGSNPVMEPPFRPLAQGQPFHFIPGHVPPQPPPQLLPRIHSSANGLDSSFTGPHLADQLSLPRHGNMWNNVPAHQLYPHMHTLGPGPKNPGIGPGPSNMTVAVPSHQGQGQGRTRFRSHDSNNSHRKLLHHNQGRRPHDDGARFANAKLADFVGSVYSLCKDQHGCRFLQRQLAEAHEQGKGDVAATIVFNEVYLKVVELMLDPFGNYLVQKLFERVNSSQLNVLVKNALPQFYQIAMDPHGTRALQKLVECIDEECEALIVEALTPNVVLLSRDLNGNHVVQKCLQNLKNKQFVFDAVLQHCVQVATHRHGCCVLQRCLDYGSAEQRTQLLRQAARHAPRLSLDPFGNYVVQYVFLRGDTESIAQMLEYVTLHIVEMLLHKYGLNVIERCLTMEAFAPTLVNKLLEHQDRFAEMLNDAYGNYVLQTSLDVAKGPALARMSLALQPLLPLIKNTPHSRRINAKIHSSGATEKAVSY